MPETSAVEAALYDVFGRRGAVFQEGLLGVGEHALPLDVSGLSASGGVRAAGGGHLLHAR